MLVLTRGIDQRLILELPDLSIIELVVADVRGTEVRIGIEASQDVRVYREEVYERVVKARRDEEP